MASSLNLIGEYLDTLLADVLRDTHTILERHPWMFDHHPSLNYCFDSTKKCWVFSLFYFSFLGSLFEVFAQLQHAFEILRLLGSLGGGYGTEDSKLYEPLSFLLCFSFVLWVSTIWNRQSNWLLVSVQGYSHHPIGQHHYSFQFRFYQRSSGDHLRHIVLYQIWYR